MDQFKVLIGIQARSNSTRFPNKIYEKIGLSTVLQQVVNKAWSAKKYLERANVKRRIECEIVVLHPSDDTKLISQFKQHGVSMVGGSEMDVLSRYLKAYEIYKPDYIVRLTSDCPMLLDHIISKHINVAVINDYDYVTNTQEEVRMFADGMDVEVLSAAAIKWLANNAISAHDREHVTTAIKRELPRELRRAVIIAKMDSSKLKISIDTKEDLEFVRELAHSNEFKKDLAETMFGKRNVFEL